MAVSAQQECIILRQSKAESEEEGVGEGEREAGSAIRIVECLSRLLRLRFEIKTRRMQRKYLM